MSRWLAVVAGLWLALPVQAAVVEALRISSSDDRARLVVESDRPLNYQLMQLANPARVVVDITAATLSPAASAQLPQLAGRSGLLTALRAAPRGSGLRLVLESEAALTVNSFNLAAAAGVSPRLVVDLTGAARVNKTLEAVVGTARRNIVIAIDAGHGGKDPGALGPHNIQEKRVTYELARELAAIVDRAPGFESYLVRRGDQFLPLRERSAKARHQRADFFVSIHADAFTNPQANGASVYALSTSGATSETASFLAERENNADLIGGVESLHLVSEEPAVAEALLGLSMDFTLRTSSEVGERVLNEIGKVARLHKKRVEKAAFIVLKSPDLPSLLIETGFISNPTEARRLTDRSYQRRLAQAIFNGLRSHYQAHPPPDSYLADPAAIRTHVVARGDTLSELAARYGVSQRALRERNKLAGSSIRIGQQLIIPPG